MKIIFFVSLLLPLSVMGKIDVCVSTIKSYYEDDEHWVIHDREHPESTISHKATNLPREDGKKFCDLLPKEVDFCDGHKMKLVKTGSAGIKEIGECGINLEVDGKTYVGRPGSEDCTKFLGDPGQPSPAAKSVSGYVIFDNIPVKC
ncbi:hypothetical protein FQN50_004934 [Emmonsiellopsis sp. PD_5]|nr:hypothetical protein FQN50_004934 [Emmonsiellopsis sp. PD_5]